MHFTPTPSIVIIEKENFVYQISKSRKSYGTFLLCLLFSIKILPKCIKVFSNFLSFLRKNIISFLKICLLQRGINKLGENSGEIKNNIIFFIPYAH